MSKLVKQAITLLRKEGFRITEQRKAILGVLAKGESPMSADECFARLTKVKCDLVTIYRCLEQFEKAGIVELGVRENGPRVYYLGHGHEGGHHHHLTCRNCGHAERVDICLGNELEDLAKGHGFTKVTHVMEVFGLCPSCS
jgi:Fur family ferric uptake transcriptional regulator